MDGGVIYLDKVGLEYSGRNILEEISHRFDRGKIYSILGPNGAGKTSLLRLILGEEKPSYGAVYLDAKNIHSHKKKDIAKKIAFVPQDYSIRFPFTVAEVVMTGRYPHRSRFSPPSEKDWSIAEDAIDKLGLWELRNDIATHLSGGEMQRVCFARALAQESEILLLDEATSGMDIKHRMETLRICRELSSQGRIIISTFHEPNIAASISDEIIFLKNGKLIEAGHPEKVISKSLLENIYEVNGIEIISNKAEPIRIIYPF